MFSFLSCLRQERTLRTNTGKDDGGMLCDGSSLTEFSLSVCSENHLHKSNMEYDGVVYGGDGVVVGWWGRERKGILNCSGSRGNTKEVRRKSVPSGKAVFQIDIFCFICEIPFSSIIWGINPSWSLCMNGSALFRSSTSAPTGVLTPVYWGYDWLCRCQAHPTLWNHIRMQTVSLEWPSWVLGTFFSLSSFSGKTQPLLFGFLKYNLLLLTAPEGVTLPLDRENWSKCGLPRCVCSWGTWGCLRAPERRFWRRF